MTSPGRATLRRRLRALGLAAVLALVAAAGWAESLCHHRPDTSTHPDCLACRLATTARCDVPPPTDTGAPSSFDRPGRRVITADASCPPHLDAVRTAPPRAPPPHQA